MRDTFVQSTYAAELVGAVVYLRALLQRAREHDPEVVSLRVTCQAGDAWAVDVAGEYVNGEGAAVGGFSL